METIQILIIVTLLAILAEVTYLVVKLPRQTIGRKQGRPILVDTSVLIDGRIIAVAQSGFIGDTLVIPRSVIGELQYLADNADHDKRARARYGLDVVQELQAMPSVEVEILQDGSKATEGVDERLLTLAKKYNAAVCTIDYNLNKVAVVEGITVLNVNELAQSLRMAYLPGEKMLLELVQKGQDAHQGVGYLADGTMVVVEHANKFVGQTVEIEFIRSLQTAAGKMMFARRVEPAQPKQVQKPIGKRPVAKQAQPEQKQAPQKQVAKKPEVTKQTQQKQPNEPKPVEKKQAQPAVYHSDSKEQRRSDGQAKNEATALIAKKQGAHRGGRGAKRRTSADREASLINLVNKQ
jgi:rRNA-processing protein FCF1